MRINRIKILNTIKVKDIDLVFHKPVALVCGKNRQGKSSIAEALRQCLTLEVTRVDKKNEYQKLVLAGEKLGSVMVEHDQGDATTIILPKGDGANQMNHPALPFCLQPNRFATLDATSKRDFLLKLMGVKLSIDFITERLKFRGVDQQRCADVVPYLAAGIEAAQKQAATEATKAKGEWKGITQENYGSQKAEGWKAEVPQFEQWRIDEAQKSLAEINHEIEDLLKQIGQAGAPSIDIEALKKQIETTREKAGKYARIQDKLNLDLDGEAEWALKLAEAKAATGSKVGLIHDMARLLNEAYDLVLETLESEFHKQVDKALNEYEAAHGHIVPAKTNPELAAKVPEFEKAHQLMVNAVLNGRRDLAEADAAAKLLTDLEAQLAQAADAKAKANELTALNEKLKELKAQKLESEKLLQAEQQKAQAAQVAQERTDKAAAAHASVKAWDAISEALKPEGIPSELLGQALGPFNQLLAKIQEFGWIQCQVNNDMSIDSETHDYRLLSESHQWRVDTAIALAIAIKSGIKFVCLDRVDVLDGQSRGALLYLIDDLVYSKELDGALLLATLKCVPEKLPESIQAQWIENGLLESLVLEEMGQAA